MDEGAQVQMMQKQKKQLQSEKSDREEAWGQNAKPQCGAWLWSSKNCMSLAETIWIS